MKVERSRLAIDANKFRSTTNRRTCNKMLDQPRLLRLTEPTLSHHCLL